MKRDEWEEVLYANVKDEVEQDMLNQYVLELEDENARLRSCLSDDAENARQTMGENAKLREENKRLMCVAVKHYTELLNSDDVLGQIMARKKLQELGIKVDK